MRIVILLSFIAAFLTGCDSAANTALTGTTAPRVTYTGGGLKQVQGFAGKRVREIELWDAPDMKERFEKMLGDGFPAFTEEWLVEGPITVDGDVLMAAGCEQNNCEKNQWVLIADVANDNMNLYNIKNGDTKIYKERKDEIKLPQAFSDELDKLKAVQGAK